MKDVEILLKQSGSAKPRRALRADFTSNITDYLVTHPHKTWRVRFMEIRTMKWFTKPAIALSALAFTVIAGSGAYAMVGGWPGVAALFGGQQNMTDGSRIVKVDTRNCTYLNAFTATEPSAERDVWYYRVKSGSKLTNEQIVQMVQGNCFIEEQSKFDQQVISGTLNANPLNKDRVVGGYIDSEVIAVDVASISLRSVVPYVNNGSTELKTTEQTFRNIAPDVLVYESPNKLSWSDIKVGDRVSIQYRASGDALAHSETIAPDQINPDEQVVVAVIKNSRDLSAAVNYQKYNGSEFEQVVPCSSQANGYCNYEQYNMQK